MFINLNFLGVSGQISVQHSLKTDKESLLEFKKSIKIDPKLVLSNWNATTEVCSFYGIDCNDGNRVTTMKLVGTKLVGPFSPVITNLTALRTIDLSDNELYGSIPHGISSLRNLESLLLDLNSLEGLIPESLSTLSNLMLLDLGSNLLHGEIPPSLFSNCTLSNLDLSYNNLVGKIPSQIGNCPDLWNLNLYNNQFIGEIPSSLTNATNMYNLDVEYNNLSGELPSNLVSKLPNLRNLHLSYNRMVSHDNNNNLDVFFTALSNCSTLKELELAGMGLGGTLPDSIKRLGANFSYMMLQENRIYGSVPSIIAKLSNLIYVNLSSNLLNGTISPEISRLTRLDKFWLSHNFFTGEIPKEIGYFRHLGELELSHNRFTGEIPVTLGNLIGLSSLSLNNNLLTGNIPSSLGNCISLSSLDLSYNRLTGKIPPGLLSAMSQNAIFLNLSHNHLSGSLPPELSMLVTIKVINLSFNSFTGSAFPKISSYMAVEILDLSSNSFHDELPEYLSTLTSLEEFDVSNNSLSGTIPVSLSKIPTLRLLNLSFNNFQGKVPTGGVFNSVTSLSFVGNPNLCGHVSGLRSCHHKKKLRRITGSKAKPELKPQPELNKKFPRITYKELVDATNGFDEQRLLGSGGFGRVYKGSLPDGIQIAVKVLQLQTGNSTKSFNRECQVLKRIRHRNLIRIITACSLPDFKALVLPFMANGSLDNRLYPDSPLGSGSSDINLIQRNMGNSTADMLCGSIGYIAPEYAYGSITSTKGDVYSFGILVLEMVTRKRPTDDMFSEGLSMHKWVKTNYHRHMEHVVDSTLVQTTREQLLDVKKMWEVAIGELLELGILCTQELPSSRPTMLDVAGDLDRLKRYLTGETTATFASSLGISSSTTSIDD
ncbi:protein kinase-like domain-containing protein [Artemisia annua]|uniref:Protein kinase-like domain-containing protein n=1 Tax=Artemisia annua TaxID=35608 RepID=A0A2U1NLD0_ARTAN|nr:protein kinase-like domain-containing protein [Artemisia annua]